MRRDASRSERTTSTARASGTVARLALALAAAALVLGLFAAPSSADFTKLGSFGGSELPSEAMIPERLAVDQATGAVYVADPLNGTVDVFDKQGAYIEQITEADAGESLGIVGTDDAIAVDNSGGANQGNVYLVGVEGNAGKVFAFEPKGGGGFEKLWGGENPNPFPKEACGIAVDPSGNVWLSDYRQGITQLKTAGEGGLPALAGTGYFGAADEPCHTGIDSAGTLYAAHWSGEVRKFPAPYSDGTASTLIGGENFEVATDLSTDDVFTSTGGSIAVYDSAGNPVAGSPFGSGNLLGIAVNGPEELVYVGNTANNEVEIWSSSPNPPRPFALNVNGNGTVECEEEGAGSFGPCAALYDQGTVVNLKGQAASGYALAGWIGCKQTGPQTCKVTIGEETEVTAVFFKEGTQGPVGPQGPAGSDGTQGPTGQNGDTGAAGPQGPKGDTGAQGPAGPAAKVTCKVKQQGKKKVKVTCTVKQSGASASRVQWRLTRAGHTVRHGVVRHGHLRLGHLPPGRYRLHIAGQHGSTPIAIG